MGVARSLASVALTLLVVMVATPARAYRPFEGTDADVASPGELEIEFGALGYARKADVKTFSAPFTIINLGLIPRVEFVFETTLDISDASGKSGFRATDVAVPDLYPQLKMLLRKGALQHEGRWPSVAFEVGVRVPVDGSGRDVGFTGLVIASEVWGPVALHLNQGFFDVSTPYALSVPVSRTLARQRHATWIYGLIGEVSVHKRLKLVAEVNGEWAPRTDEGPSASTLVGAVFEVREHFSLDAAARFGWAGDAPSYVFTVGLTIAFQIFGKAH